MAAKKAPTILTAHQRTVLDAIAGEKYFADRYYLAGGTALSEFYLHHRLSEDLDFFTEQQEVNKMAVMKFLKKNSPRLGVIRIETKQVYGLYSCFLRFTDNTTLKVDFNYYPFPRIERGMKYKNLWVDSVYDIAVNKVHTIVMKPRARDYVDLYFIIRDKQWNLEDLLMQAKAKFDWDITLVELGSRFAEAVQMSDFPRMLKPINHQEWKQFFVKEAAKLKSQIFE
ncbi:MAG: nucleotidyl transferase AbiEii/AbiGii toxin family protein [Candidatus Magasanikbacteria bacterium]|nr:nucleotidyl transferase AbiEii/AbiGii toxin family protein [Candidatus Magasanikbacteria bacterium]